MLGKQEQMTRDIANKIRHKVYPPQTLLPSENELAILYGAARNTVRKSLNDLMSIGMIQKIRGKGSMVLDVDRMAFPISGITSFNELNQTLALGAQTKVLEISEVDCQEVAARFFIEDTSAQNFLKVVRLRIIDGESDVLDIDYLVKKIIPKVSEQEAAHSLYHYFEEDLGLNIAYATKEISVQKVSEQVATQLALDADKKAVVTRSKVYLEDTTLFQLTESYHSPNRFKFVDFARRKKI